jgi:predicted DNA-binding transcriptional regulator YafY
VPQALTYLVDDVARRHGALRAGTAGSYLRCDDEALLTAVVADRKVDSLRLRRIAPTVVVGRPSAERMLEVLREAGYAPVGESAEGAVLVSRPDGRRAAPRQRLPRPVEPPAVGDAQLGELVRAIRAGDRVAQRAATASPALDVPGVTTATTLGFLRDAARANQAVLLGYVNAQGSASQRIVEPVSVNGGYLHGYDHQRDEMRTFALHRITAVSSLPDDALPDDTLPQGADAD